MNRVSLAVTTVALLVMLILFPPALLSGGDEPGQTTVQTPTGGPDCPRPSFGAADTDAVLLCIAAAHQAP